MIHSTYSSLGNGDCHQRPAVKATSLQGNFVIAAQRLPARPCWSVIDYYGKRKSAYGRK